MTTTTYPAAPQTSSAGRTPSPVTHHAGSPRADQVVSAVSWALIALAVLVTVFCVLSLAASGTTPIGTPGAP